ncbi:hypothetical protein F4778DRAFT_760746 [Xylariomycetidae sp. FL2044]|nr:hypothetical protein F4778DRAFT_760746 [Xylariomycetidae sp. FL2044]
MFTSRMFTSRMFARFRFNQRFAVFRKVIRWAGFASRFRATLGRGFRQLPYSRPALKASAPVGIIGPIFVPVWMLFDPYGNKPGAAQEMAVEMIKDIDTIIDPDDRWQRIRQQGQAYLEIWSGRPTEDCGRIPMTKLPEFRPQVKTCALTTPDPDDPDRQFLLCLLSFTVTPTGGLDRFVEFKQASLPTIEQLAKRLDARRAMVVILDKRGEEYDYRHYYEALYWDGKRFFSLKIQWDKSFPTYHRARPKEGRRTA